MINKTTEVTVVEDIGAETTALGVDPFDPTKLRISQEFVGLAGVEKVLSVVPVRRPKRQEFVRVHPSENYRLVTAVVEDDDEREVYLLAPHLREDLGAEISVVTLFTAITRQGIIFLWPCKVPGADGRKNRWHESALSAVEYAMRRWVRVAADMNLGAYQLFAAAGEVPEPEWPDRSFHEILKIAFRDRYIESGDHPVVKRLRGLM